MSNLSSAHRQIVVIFLASFLTTIGAGAGTIPTTTTLQTTPNPSVFGRPVTLVATVSPVAATGMVTLYDGVAVLGVGKLSGGKASLTTTSLGIGIRSLQAFYNGDPSYQSSTSAALSQRVASIGQNGFQAAVAFGGVSFPRVIAVGDFNGDGHADLAVDDFDINKVSVLLGNGDGTFQAAASYATQLGPTAIVVGDFNGDSRADIAVANSATASSSVGIFLGNGDGTFQTAVNYSVPQNPHSLAVADFNADGIADLVTDNFVGNSVSVLLGNGDGTFRTAMSYSAGTGPIYVAVGDFNGDGRADIAVANQAGNNVSVLLGNGDGTFQAAVNLVVGSNPSSIAVGDFNGDGLTDLAVANGGSDNVSVLLGNGKGAFRPAVNYGAPKGLQSVAVGDFNGDGRIDLAVADSGSNNVSVLLGNGDGTFQAPASYPAGSQPIFVAVGDFNGDGVTDLAAADFVPANISVLLGTRSTGPHISPGGVVGAGLSTPAVRALSPNAIASVFGDGFAPPGTLKVVGASDLVNGRLPTNVNGVCVYVNNVPAPLFFVIPNQVNFQVPQLPAAGNVGVQVATSCGTASEVRTFSEPIASTAAAPEFFYFKQSPDGRNPIAALNAVNGNFIGPAGLIAGVNFVPALPGDVLTLFLTGGGNTAPPFMPGELPGGIGNLTGALGISVAGTTLAASDFFYAGVAPGFAGLYQLNIRIPAGTQPGNQPVILTIGGSASPAGYLFIGPGS